MERFFKRFARIAALIMLMAVMSVSQTFAAASVTISGGDNVKGGDTFYVAVTFGGGDVGRVDAQMTYDTNKLTYISGGTSTGNAGYINLSKAGTGGSVTFNIKFQAISDGSTTLKLTTYDLFDLDEVPMEEYPSASKSVSISGNAGAEQVITQETSPEEPEEPSELVGVDEMEDEDTAGISITAILIILAVILVILITVISIVLAKKKNKKKPAPMKSAARHNEREEYDYERSSHPERNLHDVHMHEGRNEADWMDELMGSGNMDRRNDHRKTYKKQAREETEFFDDWDIKDDDGHDYR